MEGKSAPKTFEERVVGHIEKLKTTLVGPTAYREFVKPDLDPLLVRLTSETMKSGASVMSDRDRELIGGKAEQVVRESAAAIIEWSSRSAISAPGKEAIVIDHRNLEFSLNQFFDMQFPGKFKVRKDVNPMIRGAPKYFTLSVTIGDDELTAADNTMQGALIALFALLKKERPETTIGVRLAQPKGQEEFKLEEVNQIYGDYTARHPENKPLHKWVQSESLGKHRFRLVCDFLGKTYESAFHARKSDALWDMKVTYLCKAMLQDDPSLRIVKGGSAKLKALERTSHALRVGKITKDRKYKFAASILLDFVKSSNLAGDQREMSFSEAMDRANGGRAIGVQGLLGNDSTEEELKRNLLLYVWIEIMVALRELGGYTGLMEMEDVSEGFKSLMSLQKWEVGNMSETALASLYTRSITQQTRNIVGSRKYSSIRDPEELARELDGNDALTRVRKIRQYNRKLRRGGRQNRGSKQDTTLIRGIGKHSPRHNFLAEVLAMTMRFGYYKRQSVLHIGGGEGYAEEIALNTILLQGSVLYIADDMPDKGRDEGKQTRMPEWVGAEVRRSYHNVKTLNFDSRSGEGLNELGDWCERPVDIALVTMRFDASFEKTENEAPHLEAVAEALLRSKARMYVALIPIGVAPQIALRMLRTGGRDKEVVIFKPSSTSPANDEVALIMLDTNSNSSEDIKRRIGEPTELGDWIDYTSTEMYTGEILRHSLFMQRAMTLDPTDQPTTERRKAILTGEGAEDEPPENKFIRSLLYSSRKLHHINEKLSIPDPMRMLTAVKSVLTDEAAREICLSITLRRSMLTDPKTLTSLSSSLKRVELDASQDQGEKRRSERQMRREEVNNND